jgi:hypothetical protein
MPFGGGRAEMAKADRAEAALAAVERAVAESRARAAK